MYTTVYYITALGINPVFISILILVLPMLSGQFCTLGEVQIYSIASRMTNSHSEQDRLLANSMLGGLVGMILGLGMISYFLKAGVDNINWQLFASSFAIFGFLILTISCLFIKERYVPENLTDTNNSVLTNIKSTFTGKHLYTIMIIFMAQLFINASSTLSVYVYDAYYGMPSVASIGGMVSLIGMLPIALCLPILVNKMGKTNMMYVASGIMIVANLIMYFLGNSKAGFSALLLLISCSAIATVIPSLLRPLYIQEVINHRFKNDGTKNDAPKASLGTLLLVVSHYNDAVDISQQTTYTIESMRLFVTLGPILMGLSWIFGLKYFYKLKNPKCIELDLLEKEHYDIKL